MSTLAPKDFWKLYETLPVELKDVAFSEETGEAIYTICTRYDVLDSLGEIVDLTGRVLVGVTPPENFEKELGKTKIDKKKIKQIAVEISRFLFVPNQAALEKLALKQQPGAAAPAIPAKNKETEGSAPAKKPARIKPAGTDKYRESIE